MKKALLRRLGLGFVIAAYIAVASIAPLWKVWAATPNGATLNTHPVMVDGANKIVSWVPDQAAAYDQVTGLAWDYLLHKVPNATGGKPAFYSYPYLNPDTGALAGWPNNPAGTFAMFIESAISYYQYSGNAEVLQFAKNVADHHLANGMTSAADNWANVPYASGDEGSLTYKGAAYGNTSGVGDGTGVIQPDKVGELGYSLLALYRQTGDTRYRDAAINAGDALASHVRAGNATQSPWPFRVVAANNTVKEQYTAHVIAPVELLDELVRMNLGNVSAYQTARTTAWNWLMAYPMQNNNWSTYFEDVPIHTTPNNDTQMNAMMTARYLLQHPEVDASWEAHVRGLIAWTENFFGVDAYGAKTIKEQGDFPHVMGSHTSRYASVNALLYQKTGDLAAKEKAFRAFNWSTYMTRSTGVVIDGPSVNNQWFTDGYGDYIRHFMVGMGAVPEWTPTGQTHLTQSTSTVSSISYGASQLAYSTFDDSSTEIIRVSSMPTGITVGGTLVSERTDLSAEGWMYDAAQSVIRIRHDSSKNVVVTLNGSPTNQVPTVSLTAPTSGATYATPATFQLSASANDFDGSISKVEFYRDGTLVGTSTTSPYTVQVSGLTTGNYLFTARAYDNQDAYTDSGAVSVSVSSAAGSWNASDIGGTGVAGSTTSSGAVVTVKGSGSDIWSTADSFHFGYQQMTGDGEIKARVASQQNTDAWALAGVMIRESLATNSKHALAALTPTQGASFDYRTAAGGNTAYVNGGAATAPTWVRLVRAGTTITAYKSTNGTSWTSMGSTTISMAATVYIGLAVTSHNNSVLGTATFDNITYTGQIAGVDNQPPVISNVGVSGANQNGATVNWTTNEPSNSQVDYGLTTSYGNSTAVNPTQATAHTQVVAGLNENTTYHYRVRSVDAAGNAAVSGDFTFQTPPIVTEPTPDTQAPTVAISNPTGGTVTGTVQVTTNATDNTAVTGVQLKLDGVNLGNELTAAPYVFTWNTQSIANGSHTLTAVARDAAGNSTTSANVTITVQNQVATGGLVASYNFNEGAGTTLTDRTGKGHTGTINGATWNTAGKYGGALSFDGTSNTVTIADANDLDLTNAMTLEAWIRPSTLTGWRTIMTKENSGGMAYSLYSGNNGSRPAFYGNVTNDVGVNGSGALSTSAWWHITGTFDGSNMRIYVNGSLVGTKALSGSLKTTTGALRLGGNSIWGEYFKGLMDDVRIYNRVLTQTEIQTDMNTAL